jgi:lipopolysaccharide/colanic/teichoic acid biosynthesis glycosyltransferase
LNYRLEDIPVAQREYQQIEFPRYFHGRLESIATLAAQSESRSRSNRLLDCDGRVSTDRRPEQRIALSRRDDLERLVRRGLDAVMSAAGLVALAPLLAAIALAIKLEDGGPVLYSFPRVGKDFRVFQFLKFRSMKCGAESGSPVTAPLDARVTRIGRVLRRHKLDELPQLINVLRGDMRFVGVRPQLEKHVALFQREYGELLQSPPGITDLATLTFRHEERFFQQGSIEEQYLKKLMPAKLKLALKYARTRTFRSDLEILCRTVLGMDAPSGAWRIAGIDPVSKSPAEYFSQGTVRT